jgi:hypothetical protein
MLKQKTDKGTHFEPRKTQQRSYFLPPGLGDAFKDFVNGNASTGARGAFIAFMALRKFPEVREQAIRAAQEMDIPNAVDEIEKLLVDAVGLKAIEEWSRSLPETERARLLAEARRKR